MTPRRAWIKGCLLLAVYWGAGIAWNLMRPLALFSREMAVFTALGVLVAPALLAAGMLAQTWSRHQLRRIGLTGQEGGTPQRALVAVGLDLLFFDAGMAVLGALAVLNWLIL